MRSDKKSLLRELKWTVLALSAAVLAMWFLFYVNIHGMIQDYAMENMEQVSQKIIGELNRSFLQLEEVSIVLSKEDSVKQFIQAKDSLDFHTKANEVEKALGRLSKDTTFMHNVILYNTNRKFYRFNGNISNTGVLRMMNIIEKDEITRHIQIRLDDSNYIGYVADVKEGNQCIGKIVILTTENDVYRQFLQLSDNEHMKLALSADGKILVSTEEVLLGKETKGIEDTTSYLLHKQVGFTPFELFVSYEDTDHDLSFLFLAAMIFMIVILLLILEVFLHFWKKKFFSPIQMVISEVESFEGGKGAILPETGMEHIDGLVRGINEMVERVEQKEKEIYEATATLQDAEIKKQKALIISLKKQISAHFTVNVLNIIKALSGTGENEKAGLLCDGLSFLLRYANAGDSFISGMDEFFVLEKYTDIMEIRYPNLFVAEIDMEDYLEDVEIPRMLLQPIIENCILHGLSNKNGTKKGLVHVYSGLKEDALWIIIEDNGGGMTKEELSALRESIWHADEEAPIEGLSHVALINIQRRIRSYFGEKYGLEIESNYGEGTVVTVKLPVVWRGL